MDQTTLWTDPHRHSQVVDPLLIFSWLFPLFSRRSAHRRPTHADGKPPPPPPLPPSTSSSSIPPPLHLLTHTLTVGSLCFLSFLCLENKRREIFSSAFGGPRAANLRRRTGSHLLWPFQRAAGSSRECHEKRPWTKEEPLAARVNLSALQLADNGLLLLLPPSLYVLYILDYYYYYYIYTILFRSAALSKEIHFRSPISPSLFSPRRSLFFRIRSSSIRYPGQFFLSFVSPFDWDPPRSKKIIIIKKGERSKMDFFLNPFYFFFFFKRGQQRWVRLLQCDTQIETEGYHLTPYTMHSRGGSRHTQ